MSKAKSPNAQTAQSIRESFKVLADLDAIPKVPKVTAK